MEHRLDPLLRPKSVAIVGASAREDSMGWWTLENLEREPHDRNLAPYLTRLREGADRLDAILGAMSEAVKGNPGLGRPVARRKCSPRAHARGSEWLCRTVQCRLDQRSTFSYTAMGVPWRWST